MIQQSSFEASERDLGRLLSRLEEKLLLAPLTSPDIRSLRTSSYQRNKVNAVG